MVMPIVILLVEAVNGDAPAIATQCACAKSAEPFSWIPICCDVNPHMLIGV